MSDTRKVDPGREREGNSFDRNTGFYGQDYHRDREAALGRDLPAGTVSAKPDDAGPAPDPVMPPDNGRRASFDPATGEVRGSGSDAGGGNPGEDFDSDAATGDGYPLTGGEGSDERAPDDLGPPHAKE